MSEETIAVLQHYRTRNGRELRLRPVRRCKGCGQPHDRAMRQQAAPSFEAPPEPLWKLIGVWVLLCASLVSLLFVAVGSRP